MVLPPNKDQLLGTGNGQANAASPDQVNVVRAPLDACIVGEDWETLVEKLKHERAKGSESDYAPWLDLFPTLDDFKDMPRFWTPELRELVRSYDGGQLEARMEIDKLRFEQVDDQWALAVVDSRSNFLPDSTFAMTPMLDMFNHNSRVKTSARVDGGDRFWLDVDSDSILLGGQNSDSAGKSAEPDWKDQLMGMFGGVLGSNEPIYKPGTQVFVSYGDFDNMETLCNYGFVDPDNVANSETFRVRLMGKAPAFLVVDPKGSVDNIINQMSLTDLRVALATPEELDSLEEMGWSGMGKMTDRNEVEVFALVAGELEEALYDAKAGAEEAERRGETAVALYLKGRQNTLERGRSWLKENFPDVF